MTATKPLLPHGGLAHAEAPEFHALIDSPRATRMGWSRVLAITERSRGGGWPALSCFDRDPRMKHSPDYRIEIRGCILQGACELRVRLDP